MLRRLTKALTVCALPWLAAARLAALEPIKTVEIGNRGEIRVNGAPFFPLMLWLQVPRHFPILQQIGANTLMGYTFDRGSGRGMGGTRNIVEYGQRSWQAGFYFVPSYSQGIPADDLKSLLASPNLLGWIQQDEPDLSMTVSDAEVVPARHMRVNPKTPFFRILDGATSSWTVLEPMAGAEFTIRLKSPVTVHSLAVWQTISPRLAVAKEVVFLGDGKEILKAELANQRGQQKFALPQPATFKELTLKVVSEHAGIADNQGWGSISEVEGFDKEGNNVLASPPRNVPRGSAEELMGVYRAIQEIDPRRPVFMTFTAGFMSRKTKYEEAVREKIYPEFVKACDIVGFDIYPIFGYGTPGDLHAVAEGTTELRKLAGPARPVYVWIETNKGSRWMTASKQPDVKPEHTRAEVWMAIIRGAKGIAYFTHKWVDPDGTQNYTQFAPDAAMQKELRRLNAQVTRWAPAILAAPATSRVRMTLRGGLPCHAMATQLDGALYVFAQNIDLGENAAKLRQFDPISPRGGQGTIEVEGLAAGTRVEVLDEDRTVVAQEGKFLDEFGPLAEHIYRIRR